MTGGRLLFSFKLRLVLSCGVECFGLVDKKRGIDNGMVL